VIASYIFQNPTYTLLDKFSVEKAVFFLPDTYIEEPAVSAYSGVVLTQDNNTYRMFLNLNELLLMGFASIAAFTIQFDIDKASTLGGGGGGSTPANQIETYTSSYTDNTVINLSNTPINPSSVFITKNRSLKLILNIDFTISGSAITILVGSDDPTVPDPDIFDINYSY
jgi:hypothetical protein